MEEFKGFVEHFLSGRISRQERCDTDSRASAGVHTVEPRDISRQLRILEDSIALPQRSQHGVKCQRSKTRSILLFSRR
jgi:hypothetical protein